MPKKDKNETVAVIEIGSNELRLKIAQSGKAKLKYVESLSYPLSLGRDTFNTGKISFDKVDKTCGIIKNFLSVAGEYGVSDIKAVATTAVREAVNSDYILDQIKIKTGLSVNIIDDNEEKLYIYKLMTHLISDELKQSAMMVYIGSGNIGLSTLDGGRLSFMQNIKVGSLRVSELFEDIQEYSGEFYLVVEEYLRSFTDVLEDSFCENIKSFIVSGHETAMIGHLCGSKEDNVFLSIPKDKFEKLYNEIKYKTIDRLVMDYALPAEKAEVLLPAMCVLNNLMGFTKAERIITPLVSLSDSIIFEMLYPDMFADINKEFNKNTVLCARNLAHRYRSQDSHVQWVEMVALRIFDRIKKLHGMGSREKLLLQVAAILHDVGKFINISSHYQHSYDIIVGSDIVGLNMLETKIVACLCLYHSRITPTREDAVYSSLGSRDRALVSKLSAILRIADALDRGHEQKFAEPDVRIVDDEMIITIETDRNIELEKWSFNEKGMFFEEVFGIKPVIKKKSGR